MVSIGERRIERMFSVEILTRPDKTATFILYGPRSVIAKAKAELFVVEMVKGENGVETPHLILPTELQDVVEVRDLKVS